MKQFITTDKGQLIFELKVHTVKGNIVITKHYVKIRTKRNKPWLFTHTTKQTVLHI